MPSLQTSLFFEEPVASPRPLSWLEARVAAIRCTTFADVPQGLRIVTSWGKRSRRRFGSIGARNGYCILRLNALFALPVVPEFVIDAVIAHELAHYAHGYGSGLPKQHAYPHRGGVIGAELTTRGFADLERRADEWLKANWETIWRRHAADLAENLDGRVGSLERHWQQFLSLDKRRTDAELSGVLDEICHRLKRDETSLSVDWLMASARQTGMSYLFRKPKVIRIHAALSDPKAPQACLVSEIGYWVSAEAVGQDWKRIHTVMSGVGYAKALEEASHWRRYGWSTFRESSPAEIQ